MTGDRVNKSNMYQSTQFSVGKRALLSFWGGGYAVYIDKKIFAVILTPSKKKCFHWNLEKNILERADIKDICVPQTVFCTYYRLCI